jgi:hypothetical protein
VSNHGKAAIKTPSPETGLRANGQEMLRVAHQPKLNGIAVRILFLPTAFLNFNVPAGTLGILRKQK